MNFPTLVMHNTCSIVNNNRKLAFILIRIHKKPYDNDKGEVPIIPLIFKTFNISILLISVLYFFYMIICVSILHHRKNCIVRVFLAIMDIYINRNIVEKLWDCIGLPGSVSNKSSLCSTRAEATLLTGNEEH